MLDCATSTNSTTVQYLYKNWNFIEVYKCTCFFCGWSQMPERHILKSLKTSEFFFKNKREEQKKEYIPVEISSIGFY